MTDVGKWIYGYVYMKKKLTIRIMAKCSDMFSATLVNGVGNRVGDFSGYVPEWMPGQHFGDYVELDIDVETGVIRNWKRPSIEGLKKTFGDDIILDTA